MKKVSYLNIVYGDETAERIHQNMEETMSLYSHTLLEMEFEELLWIRSEKEFEKIVYAACTNRAERAKKHRLEEIEKRLERRK